MNVQSNLPFYFQASDSDQGRFGDLISVLSLTDYLFLTTFETLRNQAAGLWFVFVVILDGMCLLTLERDAFLSISQ